MNREASSVVGWHTSSYSMNGGGQCVEVGWHVSSYSAGPFLDNAPRTAVRDSTQRGLGFLSFPAAEWDAFLCAAAREAL
ncbi:DUF397 domain-containing protein [Actinorugispora endophytica]|uniref:Uncharacterized protein DUF397 n=1 Tax=Actinorugispora endophytica TaxID=1605990 RepID=A0A4R6UH84_9ACTN|nr:DUF397 domain-containing protein [Actinorugispora endophytica]TDQ45386.1 uncharacterized protein DUF397 [Actinorugispora endophytica]